MKNLFKRILNRIWQDVYIAVSFTILRPLATTCRQATLFRDTEYDRAGFFGRTKYYLHLSICEPCTRYLHLTEYFEKNLAAYNVTPMSGTEAEKFNQQLIRTLKQN